MHVIRYLVITLAISLIAAHSQALFVSNAVTPESVLETQFPNATWQLDVVTNRLGASYPYWQLTENNETVGYAFQTNDVHRIPAYSGEPVNMLVVISPEGYFMHAEVLEHHEPILLVGIPESKLDEFTDQYQGLDLRQRIKVGGNAKEGQVQLDGLSGATVTVMVMNVGISRGATELARALGLIEEPQSVTLPATINMEISLDKDWTTLTGDGSVRRLRLSNETVESAFEGTDAARPNKLSEQELKEDFTDLFFALADIPTVGQNLLGDSEYEWLRQTLAPGEHALLLLGNGYSFKGSGYVRGGIFDRIQLLQNDLAISFRDLDHVRIMDLYATGTPRFSEMSLFIIRDHHGFDPGQPWQLELLVRRQLGAVDSLFTSFKGEYETPEAYLIRPEPIIESVPLQLWQQVWLDKSAEIAVLLIGLTVLLAILFFQDILVRHPRLLHNLRHGYLIFTVLFIGWYCAGQISIVNVFTFLNAFMTDFNWQTFLLDPIIFIMWVAVAVTALMWGRGVFCGWLCPFGALQELINHVARKLKVPQYELPFSIHERLWAIKYLVLLALFGLSIQSLALAEQYAEIEPFKTTFLLRFSREWGFVLWAVVILISNLFQRKTFCRYLCPLGAALSVPTNIKLFDWLKRRKECGQPCRVCANECEIQAIQPNGVINQRECHYCLDCQMTYFNADKCPPLVNKKKKARKQAVDIIETVEIRS